MPRRPRRPRGLPFSGTTMMRYFFNVHADEGIIPDLVGTDLPHIEEVRKHAAAHVADLWEARVLAGQPPYVGWLGVVDEQERAVFQIPL